jgi:phenylalanyl-tRNA synthetase beta chain
MKISYEWLREYVNTKIRPAHLADYLTMAGHEVSQIERYDNDYVFDIEVTPNRPDCLCHIGMAREAAAILNRPFKLPCAGRIKDDIPLPGIKVRIEDKSACPLYACSVIRGVKPAASPKWLVKRICSMGLRPVNNIVDMTNFVLFETGHPLHAFDLDTLSGGDIVVRKAVYNESIITIDGIERKLSPNTLIIADNKKPIAIAGIMGGQLSSVTNNTKNILLESAYFEPVGIRRSSLGLGLSTDSSYRFERGTDIHNVIPALKRACALISGIGKCNVCGFKLSSKPMKQPVIITLRVSYLNKLLGTSLTSAQIKGMLNKLGYKVNGTAVLKAVAPSYRSDTTREADLIEEIARIYGYKNIESLPVPIIMTDEGEKSKDYMAKRALVRSKLVSRGFHEIISYSLISKEAVKSLPYPERSLIGVKNALSKEQEIMRPCLLPGILKTAAHNISRQVYDIRIFELSNIYIKNNTDYTQKPSLAVGLYQKTDTSCQRVCRPEGFFALKGTLENLIKALGIREACFEKTASAFFENNTCVSLLSANNLLGSMGSVKQDTLDACGIQGAFFYAEFDFDKLVLAADLKKYYTPLPRYPYSYRDISFSINMAVQYKEIEKLIKSIRTALIENVELLSEYKGRQIEEGCRSLTVRVLYRSKEKTLAEEEISSIDNTIRNKLKEIFKASLR